MTIRLSNRQFSMLKMFDQGPSGAWNGSYNLTEIGAYNQTTFGSLLRRGYVQYDRKETAFRLSKEGKEALREWHQVDITRKVASLTLTSYFRR